MKTNVFSNVALPSERTKAMIPNQNTHNLYPLVSPQPFSQWPYVTVTSKTLHRSSFKNSQIYIAPVHEQVKMLLINTLHHLSEREFIPLAAAAAASFAFFSSSFFFAASSLCFLIMARRARSALAWSVFPAKCIFM